MQAQLAATTLPQIGSICSFSKDGDPILGKLSSAPFEGLPRPGPFVDAPAYFCAVARGRLASFQKTRSESNHNEELYGHLTWCELGILAFIDIVQSTDMFRNEGSNGPFHFNHMDLSPQNILVDENFDLLAVIDWEFAQTAPWEVNHYPMPFPLTRSPAEEASILADEQHLAYSATRRQHLTRKLYRESFLDIEQRLKSAGRALARSIAETLDSPSARIFGCFEKLVVFVGQEKALTHEMVRTAFGYSYTDAENYLAKILSLSSELTA